MKSFNFIGNHSFGSSYTVQFSEIKLVSKPIFSSDGKPYGCQLSTYRSCLYILCFFQTGMVARFFDDAR